MDHPSREQRRDIISDGADDNDTSNQSSGGTSETGTSDSSRGTPSTDTDPDHPTRQQRRDVISDGQDNDQVPTSDRSDSTSGGQSGSTSSQQQYDRELQEADDRQSSNQPTQKRNNTDKGAADKLLGKSDEALSRFLDQSSRVAKSDLSPGQRASAYTRLLTRHTLGPGAAKMAWGSPTGQFAGQKDDTSITGSQINPSPTGIGDLLRSGRPGELNTAVTNDLTKGRGLISDQREKEKKQDIKQRQEVFGVGKEVEKIVREITGSDTAAEFAGGIGTLPGTVAAAPAGLTLSADTAAEAASNLPETVSEHGAGATAEAAFEVGGRATKSTVNRAEKNPARFAGTLTGELALGYGIGRLAGSPVKYESAKVPNSGETTTYRGITTKMPGSTPTPRIGVMGKRPTLGAPEVDLEGPPKGPDSAGMAPQSPLEASIWDANLRSQLEGKDLQRYEAGKKIAERLGDRSRREVLADRLTGGTDKTAEQGIREAQQIPDEAAKEVTEWLKKTESELGGSVSQLMQTGKARTPDDIDVYTGDTQKAQKELFEILNQYENRPMRRQNGIEVKTESGWDHMVDVNDLSRARGNKDWAGELYRPTRSADGVKIQPIESQVNAKLEGAMRLFDNGEIAPKTWRSKDVVDVGTIAEQMAEQQRKSLNPITRLKSYRTKAAAESWKDAWGDLSLPNEQHDSWGDLEGSFETTALTPETAPVRIPDIPSPELPAEFQAFISDTRGQATAGGTGRDGFSSTADTGTGTGRRREGTPDRAGSDAEADGGRTAQSSYAEGARATEPNYPNTGYPDSGADVGSYAFAAAGEPGYGAAPTGGTGEGYDPPYSPEAPTAGSAGGYVPPYVPPEPPYGPAEPPVGGGGPSEPYPPTGGDDGGGYGGGGGYDEGGYGGGGGGGGLPPGDPWDDDDRRRRGRDEEEDDRGGMFGPFAGYGEDWVNPVATAEEALDATIAGVEESTGSYDRALESANAALEDTLASVDEQIDDYVGYGGGRR